MKIESKMAVPGIFEGEVVSEKDTFQVRFIPNCNVLY